MVSKLLIIMLLVPSLCWGGATARRFSTGPKTRHVTLTFNYTGGPQTFNIPSDAYTTADKISHGVHATIVGAGGAGTAYYGNTNQPGQAGDMVNNVYFLGSSITIYVGHGGYGTNEVGCIYGGAAWGYANGQAAPNCVAGGGGGSSAVVGGSPAIASGGNGGGTAVGSPGGLGGNYPAIDHNGAPGGAALLGGEGTTGPNGTNGWVTIDYWQ